MNVRVLSAASVLLLGVPALSVSASLGAGSAGRLTQRAVSKDNAHVASAAAAVDTYLHRRAGGGVEVRGVVRVVHADPEGQSGPGSFTYSIQLEGNRTVEVTPPVSLTKGVAADQPALRTGQIVTAYGQEGARGEIAATTIDPDGSVPVYGPQPITTDVATQRGPTVRKALVIPVAYANDPDKGSYGAIDIDEVARRLNGVGGSSTNDFYRQTSAGVEAAPLPLTAGDISFNFEVRPMLKIAGNRPASAELCKTNPELSETAINSRLGIDPLSAQYGAYDHYLYLLPCSDATAWGSGMIRGPVSTYYGGDWTAGVFAHELGHNLGLGHSNRSECAVSGIPAPTAAASACTATEYGGHTDTMGGDGLLSPYHRVELGFIPRQNLTRITPAEGRVGQMYNGSRRLALGTAQLLQVPRPRAAAAGELLPYYYLSIRGGLAPFDVFGPGHPLTDGVEIQRGRGLQDNKGIQPEVVQTHPFVGTAAAGETRAPSAYTLALGRSFYDPLEDYTITTRALVAGDNAQVTVEPGPPRGAATSAAVTAGRLVVRGGGSAANSVEVGLDGTDLVVADHGNVLTPGNGCARAVADDPQVVRCAAAPVDAISLLLGGGSDQASVAPAVTKPVTADGGAGDDTLVINGAGDDTLIGGAGQDFLDPSGAGFDTLSYADQTAPVAWLQPVAGVKPWRIAVSTGEDEVAWTGSTVRTTVPFERLIGGAGDDTLQWTQGTDPRTIDGGPGADMITTGPGADTVYSRDGVADRAINCGAGNDSIDADVTDTSVTSCNAAPVAAVIAAGPEEGSAVRPSANPTFTLRSYLTPEQLQCRIEPDQSTFTSCGTSFPLPTVTDGPKTLSVRAVINGTPSAAVATRTFVVDRLKPTVSIAGQPPATDGGRYATFSFSSSEQTGQFTCTLDGVDQACQSPVSFDTLGERTHTFSVRAVDEAGNLSDPSPTVTWTVVRNLPDTQIASGPSTVSTTPTPRFDFTSSGPAAAGFDCRFVQLDANVSAPPFAPCSNPSFHQPSSALPDGEYSFEVRARNAAGIADQTPATREFKQLAAAGVATLSGATLTVVAAPGRENRIRVRTALNSRLTVEDAVPLRGVGCLQITAYRITCPAPGLTSIYVAGGDLNDRLDADTPIPTSLYGQAGDDVLSGTGSARDTFSGGDGVDSVTYLSLTSPVMMTANGLADDGPIGGTPDLIGSDVESLIGGNGPDQLFGGGTLTTLNGGRGNDTLTAGSGGGRFVPSPGNDRLVGSVSTADVFDASVAPGASITVDLRAGAVTKELDATPAGTDTPAGIERWIGTSSPDAFVDGPGDDEFVGGGSGDKFTMTSGGSDRVDAGDGADQITDGPGNDTYLAGLGGDTIKMAPNGGQDLVNGGPDNDPVDLISYADYATSVKVSFNGVADDGAVGQPADADTVTAVEKVTGGAGDDTLVGSPGADELDGGPGNDTMNPGPGDPAGDLVVGGTGSDTYDLRGATNPINLNLSSMALGVYTVGTSALMSVKGVETFRGGSADDTMRLSGSALGTPITFDGGLGNDSLTGGNAADWLLGGPGNDVLTGGAGADFLSGDDGADVFNARDGTTDSVFCGAGVADVANLDSIDEWMDCETENVQ